MENGIRPGLLDADDLHAVYLKSGSEEKNSKDAALIPRKKHWRDCHGALLSGPQVGGRSSMVELQIVILVVAGSSPVDHPTFASSQKGMSSSQHWLHVADVTSL